MKLTYLSPTEAETSVTIFCERVERVSGQRLRIVGGIFDNLTLPLNRLLEITAENAENAESAEEKLWLDCTRWLLNQCLGDSGTGASYWEQFPQFRTLCALAGGTAKIMESQEGQGS